MDGEQPMNKERLTKALGRFDPVTREHGLGESAGYMVTIPRAINTAILIIFRDQVPEDEDTRIIREALGKLRYVFEDEGGVQCG